MERIGYNGIPIIAKLYTGYNQEDSVVIPYELIYESEDTSSTHDETN